MTVLFKTFLSYTAMMIIRPFSSLRCNTLSSSTFTSAFSFPASFGQRQSRMFLTRSRNYQQIYDVSDAGLGQGRSVFYRACINERNPNDPIQKIYSSSTSLSMITPATSEASDTVFALSSGGGNGEVATAVAVIRISGRNSLQALERLMNPPCHIAAENDNNIYMKRQLSPKPRYAALRTLYEQSPPLSSKSKAVPLDQALVLYFPGPNSFTGEDIIELHTHGSRAVVTDVLDTLAKIPLDSPATDEHINTSSYQLKTKNYLLRPADRGEFTQRAYQNGKLGLVEVEALADLIVSDTAMQRRQALLQMDGRVTKIYENWRNELIKGLAHAEAVIDFGDDEDLTGDDDDDSYSENGIGGQSLVWGTVRDRVDELLRSMKRFLQDDQRGEIVRDGIKIAIVGAPNAGKSSLLNALAKRDVAIVSPIAGTTRDVVDVILDLGGVRCIVSDTAGVREETGGDIIEEEGIRRATKAAKEAHIVIFMEDVSQLHQRDKVNFENSMKEIMGIMGLDNEEDFNGVMMKVQNKIDLVKSPEICDSENSAGSGINFGISCSTGSGIDKLLNKLEETVLSRISSPSSSGSAEEGLIITRARHRRHISEAVSALSRFMELTEVDDLMTVDLAAEELRLSASELGRITGAVDVEDVLDVLFADFCIGK